MEPGYSKQSSSPPAYISASLLIFNFNCMLCRSYFRREKKKAIKLLSLFLACIINQREVILLVLQSFVALTLAVQNWKFLPGYIILQGD